MKTQNLSLSLLIRAALTIPSLAMAAPAQSDVEMAAADTAMQTEVTSANSETGADQSSPFAINERRTISRSSVNSTNSNANQQSIPTELQTQQQDMQNPEEVMIQEEDSPEAMTQEQEDLMQEEDMVN